MWARIAWYLAIFLIWGTSWGARRLQNLLQETLSARTGLHVSSLDLYCGGVVEASGGRYARGGDEASFAYLHFGPRWLSLLDGRPFFELQLEAPEIRTRTPERPRWPGQRIDRLQNLLKKISLSFEHGRLEAVMGKQRVRMEELRASSRGDGNFLLEAPIFYMISPGGEWLGKNAVVETRGRSWERVQISFVRISGPNGVWLDAGGTLERVSSNVYAADVYLRHADEYATVKGRINAQEEKFVLDVSFASSIASLLEYAQVFFPLGHFRKMVSGGAQGEAHIVWQKRPVLAHIRMNLSEIRLKAEMFSTRELAFPDISLEASTRNREDHVSIAGRVDVGGRGVRLDARWEPGKTLKIDGKTNVFPCSEWLQLGRDLLPRLQGMELAGDLGLRFGLWFDLQDAEKFNAAASLDGAGCTVVRDAPAADPHELLGPVEVTLQGRFGGPVKRRMDPSDPAFSPLSKIPKHTVAAFLIAEDRRFREHNGFDWPMIIKAAGYNLKHRGFFKGASSISQQLVKNLYLSSTRSISRKLEEAILTWRMEQVVPKDRILELYLNIIEMGPGLYGITDGARVYFQREVRNLVPVESAHLALVTPAPNFHYFNLRRRAIPDAWTAQVKGLLRKMHAAGVFAPEEWPSIRERPLVLQDY